MSLNVAISACLLGEQCRYDGSDNKNIELLEKLKDYKLIPFCPEDFCFGTPRPTMDLIKTSEGIKAISNLDGANLTPCIRGYAKEFFKTNPNIDLLIGKDRSPSCGVCSSKLYNEEKELIDSKAMGIMVKEAQELGVEVSDAETYLATHQ